MASPALAGCSSITCKERVARKHCSNQRPQRCVDRAILTYKLTAPQAAWMHRVAWCESRWNPLAANPSGSFGLYQFMRGTWLSTPYAGRDWTRAKWQALAAGWMVGRAGRGSEWVCR
jgi:hypothetical protein